MVIAFADETPGADVSDIPPPVISSECHGVRYRRSVAAQLGSTKPSKVRL
jgi:hypothetical protein